MGKVPNDKKKVVQQPATYGCDSYIENIIL